MPETVVPSYRYYVADLLTGAIAMEIPFGQVSWERKITTAGSFSGSIQHNSSRKVRALCNARLPVRVGWDYLGQRLQYLGQTLKCVSTGVYKLLFS